jgi:cation diffusion facilitator family transporter
MHFENLSLWQHSHTFGQELKRSGESRTILVAALTGVMMAVEIATGIIYGSMALLADGLHMASHAAALGINVFAYIYARRHAHDPRYSFGTGKINALGGFTGGVLLAVLAIIMAAESGKRIIHPVAIAFDQAILVAILGLIVNGASVFILGNSRNHNHSHDDEKNHDHDHGHHDHNLRSAYLHVLADALTSVLAILALLSAKYMGLTWMDPLMGIIGAVLVTRWSLGLLRATGSILLDRQAPGDIQTKIRESLERHDDNRVADLHLWTVGPNLYSLIVAVVTKNPREPEYYKRLLPPQIKLAHITIEVHRCSDHGVHEKADAQYLR